MYKLINLSVMLFSVLFFTMCGVEVEQTLYPESSTDFKTVGQSSSVGGDENSSANSSDDSGTELSEDDIEMQVVAGSDFSIKTSDEAKLVNAQITFVNTKTNNIVDINDLPGTLTTDWSMIESGGFHRDDRTLWFHNKKLSIDLKDEMLIDKIKKMRFEFTAVYVRSDSQVITETDQLQIEVLPEKLSLPDLEVSAGSDINITGTNSAVLNGSYNLASSDIDLILWSADDGGAYLNISNTGSLSPQITGKNPSVTKTVNLTLLVRDVQGRQKTDSIFVTIDPEAVVNQPPVAYAGNNISVNEGDLVTMPGSGTDPDGVIALYTWGVPADVSLENPNLVTDQNMLTFTAPEVLFDEKYIFTLTVTDNDNAEHSDTVTITVNDTSVSTPATGNQNPIADFDFTADSLTPGQIVMLDASDSTDDKGIVRYYWYQSGGGTAVKMYNISSKDSASFIAPEVSSSTLITMSLLVVDEEGAIDIQSKIITVTPATPANNIPPSLSATFAPNLLNYEENQRVNLVANLIDLDGEISKVNFNIFEENHSTPISYEITTSPYMLDLTMDIDWERVEVTAYDNLDEPSNTVTLPINVTATTVGSSGLLAQNYQFFTGNDEGWKGIEFTFSDNSTLGTDLKNAVIYFAVPETLPELSLSTKTSDGLEWFEATNYHKNIIHDTALGLNKYYITISKGIYNSNTILTSGLEFIVSLKKNSTQSFSSAERLIFDNYINDRVSLFPEGFVEYDTVSGTISVGARPSSIPTSSTSVNVYIQQDEGVSQLMRVGWNQSVVKHDWRKNASYKIWADPVYKGVQSAFPNHSISNKLTLSPKDGSLASINFTANSNTLTRRSVSFNFNGINQGLIKTVTLNNLLSPENSETFTTLNNSMEGVVLEGVYEIISTNFRNPDDQTFYAPIIDHLSRIEITSDTTIDITYKPYSFGPVPGFPNHLSMGTVTDNNLSNNANYRTANITSIFKYDGAGGTGDRGLILDSSVAKSTMTQARAVESNLLKVLPTLVVYTAEASGGGYGEEDIADAEHLFMHNINLIRTARELQSYKDDDHPYPGVIVLNPDLLGRLQQGDGDDYTAFNIPNRYWWNGTWHGVDGTDVRTVEVNATLRRALNYVMANDGVKDRQLPIFEDSLFGWFQMQNYIIREFGPNVLFGWQENTWAPSSSRWVHERLAPQAIRDYAIDPVSVFLTSNDDNSVGTQVYEGAWIPDFLVFDKYERDDFHYDSMDKGHSFNHLDWLDYMFFVHQVGKNIDMPIMLWQIPGSHIATKTENLVNYEHLTRAGSGGPFFMGEPSWESMDDVRDDVKNTPMTSTDPIIEDVFYHNLSTLGAFLAETEYDWTNGYLQEAVNMGVFTILWGGGQTTGIVKISTNGQGDDDWLTSRIANYYDSGVVELPTREELHNLWGDDDQVSVPGAGGSFILRAGSDKTVSGGETVQLNGTTTASSNATFLWTVTDSSNLAVSSLSNATSLSASFIAPRDQTTRNYTATLTVTDGPDEYSDSLTITVNSVPNQLPHLTTGQDIRIEPGDLITLYGKAYDTDGSVDTLNWTVSPSTSFQQSSLYTEQSGDSYVYFHKNVDFTASSSISETTSFTFQLTAIDNDGGSKSDSVTVTVRPANTDDPPTASAGSDRQVKHNSIVEIIGTVTDDIGIKSASWSLVDNTNFSIQTTVDAETGEYKGSFTVPNVTESTTYILRLTAIDIAGQQAWDTMQLTVNPGKLPQSNITLKESESSTGGVTTILGIQDESADYFISGGAGTGLFEVTYDPPDVVTHSFKTILENIPKNYITFNYQLPGLVTASIKKLGDVEYQDSNTISISLAVESSSDGVDESNGISLVETDLSNPNEFVYRFTNVSGRPIYIENGTLRFESAPSEIGYVGFSGKSGSAQITKNLETISNQMITTLTINAYSENAKWVEHNQQFTITFNYWDGLPTFTFLGATWQPDPSEQASNAGVPLWYPRPSDPLNTYVKGWGSCLQMGTVSDGKNTDVNNKLYSSGARAIYSFIPDSSADIVTQINKVFAQAGTIESSAVTGDARKIMPVFVAKTLNSDSVSIDVNRNIISSDGLQQNFENLITVAETLQSKKNTDHPNPASVILNPHFLTNWMVNNAQVNSISSYELTIRQTLVDALTASGTVTKLSDLSTDISDDVTGYFKAINYILKTKSPDVSFGWHLGLDGIVDADNVVGNEWLDTDFWGKQGVWEKVTAKYIEFLDELGVFSGSYQPDFIVFDKENITTSGGVTSINTMAMDTNAWYNALQLVRQLTTYYEIPAMLWQIPAGRLFPGSIENTTAYLQLQADTASAYFFGDNSISRLVDIDANILNLSKGSNNISNYLIGSSGSLEASTDAWQKNRLREAAYSNIFAILWGGLDKVTGITQNYLSYGDDGGWMQGKVNSYYNNGCLEINNGGASTSVSTSTDTLSATRPALYAKLVDATSKMKKVLKHEYDTNLWRSSTLYTWDDLISALDTMATVGVSDYTFWIGDGSDITSDYHAMVNIAIFLGQSMSETIRFNACDENNWDFDKEVVGTNPKGYLFDSACGQLGQVYADYGASNPMSCPRDSKMEINAVTSGNWFGAPPPVFTAPDSVFRHYGLINAGTPTLGKWDHNLTCDKLKGTVVDHDVPIFLREGCTVYVGQRAGIFEWNGYSEGTVEGCGWWGRGVIQTTGRENFGLLNHYLGRTHVLDVPETDGRPSKVLYPDYDFCSNPEYLCSSTESSELKWIAGLFYWMRSVQNFVEPDELAKLAGSSVAYNYRDELQNFVNNNFNVNELGLSDRDFIFGASGIVNRGCPRGNCNTGHIHNSAMRKIFTMRFLEAFGLVDYPLIDLDAEATNHPYYPVGQQGSYKYENEGELPNNAKF